MKTFVICNSKTGFTRQYANWIAEETGGTVLEYADLAKVSVAPEDLAIFGSRIHAGRIERLQKVKERLCGCKHFVVFAVGAAPAQDKENLKKIWQENLTPEEQERIPHFYMQGGLNYEKMGFADRNLMKMVAKMLAKQTDKSESDIAFAAAIQGSFDASDKNSIAPLVEAVRGIQQAL